MFLNFFEVYKTHSHKNNQLNNQKIQLAVSLLNQGHSPQAVALHLGYEYYATFFAQFKKVVGRTPTAVMNKVPFAKTSISRQTMQTFKQSILKHEIETNNLGNVSPSPFPENPTEKNEN